MTAELESNDTSITPLDAYEIAETNPTLAILPLRIRVISFFTICIAGLAGALCGYAIAELLAASNFWLGMGLVVGGAIGAIGIGTVIQLGLQARPEWKSSQKPTKSRH